MQFVDINLHEFPSSQLEPLLKDRTDFVRQGAVIGMGFLCMQTSAAQANGVATRFRAELMKIATDRHQDVSVR